MSAYGAAPFLRSYVFHAMRALSFRLRLRHLGAVCAAIALASGCVSGSSADSTAPPSHFDAGRNISIITLDAGPPDARGGREGGLVTINHLCGTTDYCNGSNPDKRDACAQTEAGTGPGFRPDAGAAPDAASLPPRRDAGKGVPEGTLLDGGRLRDASVRDASSDGALLPELLALPNPPADAGPSFACQVGRDDSGRPVHQCVPSGPGEAGSPCTTVRDCAAGLGCVGPDLPAGTEPSPGEAGLCSPYCCDPTTHCQSGSYCAERRLLDGTNKKPLIVPVCARGEPCALLEPYPCDGESCTCPPSTACTVVGGDGTKGCVKPGTGKVGDRCPCAAGYYCSLATSACVKMCKTDGNDDRCAPGRCQAAAGFPGGFGLCVGYTPAKQ